MKPKQQYNGYRKYTLISDFSCIAEEIEHTLEMYAYIMRKYTAKDMKCVGLRPAQFYVRAGTERLFQKIVRSYNYRIA